MNNDTFRFVTNNVKYTNLHYTWKGEVPLFELDDGA